METHIKFRPALVGAVASLVLLAGCAQAPSSAVPIQAKLAHTLRTVVRPEAAVFSTVYRFKNKPDGAYPTGGLSSSNGMLYGATSGGGEDDEGTVFKAMISGNETILFSFAGGNGQTPQGAIVVSKGTVYGTIENGGVQNSGTVYAVGRGGTEEVLHSFSVSDGSFPISGLTNYKQQFYGSTSDGGRDGLGTLFSVDAIGEFTSNHSFGGGTTDGQHPAAPPRLVRNVIYGTTQVGGAYARGIVFVLDPVKGYSVIHSFGNGIDGAAPGNNGVVELHGVLYGTTCAGGSKKLGTVYSITPSGAERVLYNFGTTNNDGACPNGTMVNYLGTLYGVTNAGGANDDGTLFSVTVSGHEQVIHSFKGRPDGAGPIGSLVLLSGKFYGLTTYGGLGYGTIFSLKV